MIVYKAEEAGKLAILVNPRNTTATCSDCGAIKDMQLDEEDYDCEVCGAFLDRDTNSAINIKRLGLESLQTTAKSSRLKSRTSGNGAKLRVRSPRLQSGE